MENLGDQVVNIVDGEDNVVGNQGGLLLGEDGIPAAPLPNGPMHWTPV